MYVAEKHELSKAKYVEIIYQGSGNPAETHELVGVKFLDENGCYFVGIGDIPCMGAEKEVEGHII